jgi:hypothetical protein
MEIAFFLVKCVWGIDTSAKFNVVSKYDYTCYFIVFYLVMKLQDLRVLADW